MEPDQAGARTMLDLPAAAPVVAILPGSRMSELKYNAVAFVAAAKILLQRDANLRIVAPMAGAAQRRYFEELIAQAGLQTYQYRYWTANRTGPWLLLMPYWSLRVLPHLKSRCSSGLW